MAINLKKTKYKHLGFFRFKKIKGQYFLTSEEGEFIFLSEPDFSALLADKLDKNSEIYSALAQKNFLKQELDLPRAIKKIRGKKEFLFSGPVLHILVVTLRCNHRCVYCHASAQGMAKKNWDMTPATAEKCLAIMFQTTSPWVAIEFQGGEPLANWPVVKMAIEKARVKAKATGKKLELRLVSNFSLMTEDKYRFLLKHKVSLCTSLDGPSHLHNKNRPIITGNKKGDSHRCVVKWVKKFNRDYSREERKRGYIWRVAGVITVSRFSLPYWREAVDEYVKLGFNNIFLRPLNPFGFSKNVWGQIGYSADDFIEFYKKALDYIIDLNLKGVKFEERFAKIFLTKILTDYDLNMVDWRSPCGAGLGQLAYNYNGDVYTCDEGRMLSMTGDENFRLGNVDKNNYQELVSHPVVRTTCSASCLIGLPGCHDCVFQPYCGVCPVYNYFEQGNLFGQMPNNERCRISRAVLEYLFVKLTDEKVAAIFHGWLNK